MVPITIAAPLQEDTNGAIQVGGTRVPLDIVIAAFQEGTTAEEIVQQYPTLALADVYATIAYYLQHQSEVEEYLQRRHEEARRIQQENEALFDPVGARARLLARGKRA